MPRPEGNWPTWLESLRDEESECKKCGEVIYWGKTVNGKNAPYDAEPDHEGNLVCHFETCKKSRGDEE